MNSLAAIWAPSLIVFFASVDDSIGKLLWVRLKRRRRRGVIPSAVIQEGGARRPSQEGNYTCACIAGRVCSGRCTENIRNLWDSQMCAWHAGQWERAGTR